MNPGEIDLAQQDLELRRRDIRLRTLALAAQHAPELTTDHLIVEFAKTFIAFVEDGS